MAGANKKLLIIEDTTSDAELLMYRLQKNDINFKYYLVDSASQVQEHLEKHNLDLVISDFNLPGFDGIKALKMVKKYDRLIPFILLSGTINQQQETKILEEGANEVIIKSHMNRLPFAVKRVLYEAEDQKELKETKEKLEQSLQQMQVLLQEVHHRVKNNLQIISGLMELRQMEVSGGDISLINDLLVKIRSIAKVHEMLYHGKNLASIDLQELLKDLTSYTLKITSDDHQQYEMVWDIQPIQLNVNQAVPCGMIVSELIHNTVQHAFNDQLNNEQAKYRINITGRQESEKIVITVADNGSGLPEGFSFEKASSMGSTILFTLFKQLNADHQIYNKNGTSITFEFIKENKKGVHSTLV